MSLRKKQSEFVRCIGKLIVKAEELGVELTFGDAFRDARLHGDFGVKKSYSASKSVHKLRLAVDFNLFVEGNFVTSCSH